MKYQSIAIVGRQPELATAELESVLGGDNILPFGRHSVALAVAPSAVPAERLGGTVRIAKILHEFPNMDWSVIEAFLLEQVARHAEYVEGKLTFGISVIDGKVSKKSIANTALTLKKRIRAAGHSVRMVDHTSEELNSASVIHNKLTGKNGWELLIVVGATTAYLAQTVHIQDISGYAARDQKRPARDARVGMLPPKLAQIIVNLAAGSAQSGVLLDPFCGTGVLLQEAKRIGFSVYGTDLEPRMIEYSRRNLDWLYGTNDWKLAVANATTYKWDSCSFVACETYLGRPLSVVPPPVELDRLVQAVDRLHQAFLSNLATQLTPGTPLCMAVPAWYTKAGVVHLPVLAKLGSLGYTRVKYTHVDTNDMQYHRDGQIVGRELVVVRKD